MPLPDSYIKLKASGGQAKPEMRVRPVPPNMNEVNIVAGFLPPVRDKIFIFMGSPENMPGFRDQGRVEKETKESVMSRLERSENLEGLDLKGLDLAGLELEGKSFRGSDIRGMVLYRQELDENGQSIEVKTNIREADFTDAVIADLDGTDFFKVSAEGARFGYTEGLISRRKRHQDNEEKTGKGPAEKDTGGIFSFDGRDGDFMKTKWTNVDFGGGSGYEAVFDGADFSGATFKGCDLSGIDFSKTKINDIEIIDSVSVRGLVINNEQADIIIKALRLNNAEALKELGIIIVEKES